MNIIIWNYIVVSGPYYPDKNAYFTEIIYRPSLNSDMSEFNTLAEIYFYDEPEDIERPMEIKLFCHNRTFPFLDFQKCLEVAIDDVNKIRKAWEITKEVF